MKPSRPRPELLLVLSRIDQNGYSNLDGKLCYRHQPGLTPGGDSIAAGTVLHPGFEEPSDLSGQYSRYADLHVHATLDIDRTLNDGRAYGWRYEYRPYVVDLARAKSMVAFLRHIERQMIALAEQMGTPTDFAAYVTHFAAALGITHFAEYTERRRSDGTHWRWMDPEQMRSWIRRHDQPAATTPAKR